ncbi:hypothetical protein PL263_07385 [Methylomonas sp. EFPC3]|uniref:hypothetical protein n=1 Tax=Methylomonas TaxID=416 RepID=UPI00112E03D2|nr:MULTISPECIES: hypothetical protein [Methylomonas]TPQ26894.1 hypothetical protein C2U68_09400 [Methylomonas koyamae]WFP51844.1 hypothetical protein PL263_07385 [Methylomonas sp. EFPC3]
MKIANTGSFGLTIAALATAGLAGILPIDFVVPAVLFALLVRGSVALIEKALNGADQPKELDRH